MWHADIMVGLEYVKKWPPLVQQPAIADIFMQVCVLHTPGQTAAQQSLFYFSVEQNQLAMDSANRC